VKTPSFPQFLLPGMLAVSASFSSLGVHGAQSQADAVVIGTKFQIESKVLAETRTYFVHTPADYKSGKDAYPVLILQDPESEFTLAAAAVDMLSENGRIPRMIVVGIKNTNRTRDMTPSRPAKAFGGAPWIGSAGGADKFLAFIADELLPTVDRRYRTRRYRVLVGHSLGGLFDVYALMNRPDVFQGYIAISPSLWWDGQALVKASAPFFAAHKDLHADLYLTMGSEGQEMLGGAWKLSAVLEESKIPDLRWQFKRSPDEDHGTIPYLSIYEGLQAIFQGYRIADPIELFDQAGLSGLERHYVEVSKRLGYPVEVPMATYARMIWELSSKERFADAEAIGQKLLERDPKNTQTLSQLAQVAGMQKDDPRAIGYLTQALQSYPGNTGARAALVNYKVDVDTVVPSPPVPAQILASYVGKYRSQDDRLEITYENGKLASTGPAGRCELRPFTQTKFYCVEVDLEFNFQKGKNGSVTGVVAEYPDHYSDDYTKMK
jgi:predicted alpha/beta superfamily hydrolase